MSAIIKNDPYHLQAYQLLRTQIIMSQKKPGERLLEQKIAGELGISRSPIREALRMLEHDGLVVNTDNGIIVYPMELDDIKDIYQCRMATEPFAAFLAAQIISAEEIQLLRDNTDEASKHYTKGDYDAVAELTTDFHDSIVRVSGNKRLIEIIERLRSLTIMSRNAEYKMNRPRNFVDEHKEIIDVLQKRDSKESEKLLREHIEVDWKHFLEHFPYLKKK